MKLPVEFQNDLFCQNFRGFAPICSTDMFAAETPVLADQGIINFESRKTASGGLSMLEVGNSKSIEPIVTPIRVHEISMVRQVIENRKRPLDMVREQISNMCAREVGAHEVKVAYYVDPTYEASFIFEDDGCNKGIVDRYVRLRLMVSFLF